MPSSRWLIWYASSGVDLPSGGATPDWISSARLSFRGSSFPRSKALRRDAQAGFPGQIVFVRRIVLQNLRQGRFFFFSGGHPSIERRGISTPGRNQFPVEFAQQIPAPGVSRGTEIPLTLIRTISSRTIRKSSPFGVPLEKAPGTFSHTINRGRISRAARPRCLSASLISFTIRTCSIKRPERSPERPGTVFRPQISPDRASRRR